MATIQLTEEEKARREGIYAAFLALKVRVKSSLHDVTATLARVGAQGLEVWYRDSYAILERGQIDAWILGRNLAGDTGPERDSDRDMGGSVAFDEGVFLAAFAKQLADADPRYVRPNGELIVEAVNKRLNRYVARLYGTATESAVLANEIAAQADGLQLLYDWVLNDSAKHCGDCPLNAEGGPYPADQLPGYPGDGSTECGNFCLCWLRASNGFETFVFPLE